MRQTEDVGDDSVREDVGDDGIAEDVGDDHVTEDDGITEDVDVERQETEPTTITAQIKREARSLWSIAYPSVLTGLIMYGRSMVSTIFLGRLGEVELAAGSLALAFANITGYSVLSGLSLGMEPICTQAFGAKRPRLLSLTLQRCVLFLLTCSIPLAILWCNMSTIMIWLHQDANVSRVAQKYLYFLLPDLVTNSFLNPIRVYLRAQSITLPVTLASLFGVVVHILLNFWLVNYGIVGLAAAFATSSISILVFLVLYVLYSGVHRATWTPLSKEIFTGWKPLLRLAGPSCVSVCLEWWWYEIMTVLCGWLVDPTATVAAMGVLIQTTSLIYVFPSSLGIAVSARVGNELGAGRPRRAKLSGLVAVSFAGLMGISAMTFAILMRWRWGRIFTKDEDVLRLTAAALPILGLCELGNCPQTVGCGVVRGTARPKTTAYLNTGAFYLVGMPVAALLAFPFGVGFPGLWMGLLSAQLCCAGVMLFVIYITDWEQQASQAQLLTSVNDEENRAEAQRQPLLTDVDTQ